MADHAESVLKQQQFQQALEAAAKARMEQAMAKEAQLQKEEEEVSMLSWCMGGW